jgi:hypothetical protein
MAFQILGERAGVHTASTEDATNSQLARRFLPKVQSA